MLNWLKKLGTDKKKDAPLNEGAAVKSLLAPSLWDVEKYKDALNGEKSLTSMQIAAAHASIYAKMTESRVGVIRAVDSLRNFYLVETLLSQLVDDSLSPDMLNGEILTIYSEGTNKNEVNKEIEYLDEKFDLDRLAEDITPDLCAYGEYLLRTKIHKKTSKKEGNNINEEKDEKFGLIDILDCVDQEKVIPVTKAGNIQYYLTIDQRGRLIKEEPADYIRFSLGTKKIKVNTVEEFTGVKKEQLEKFREEIPFYLKTGKSIIYPVLPKLKELEILEALVPATKLSKLTQGTILGVQVPPGYSVEEGMKASKRMEGIINDKVGIDKERDEITVESIMASSGRIKVIPQFGDKGTTQKLETKMEEPDDLLSSIEELRKIITNSSGIPYELMFESDGSGKGEVLKRYARYLRKLKMIQRAVANGIKELVIIHCVNKGIEVNKKDLKVTFTNKLIELDNLDQLEYIDTTLNIIGNIKTFVFELRDEESPLRKYTNITKLRDFIQTQSALIGLDGLVTSKEIPEEPDEDEEEY